MPFGAGADLTHRWSQLSIRREQNDVSISSVWWLLTASVPFFFSSSLDINVDGLPGEWYKQVTKPAVQEFQGKNGKQWNTLTGVNSIRC